MQRMILRALPVTALIVGGVNLASAGHNVGGLARLSWDPAGQVVDASSAAITPFPLFLHLLGAPDVRELAVNLRWSPLDSLGDCYTLISAAAGPSCGWATAVPPGGDFHGDSSYTWSISFPPGSADRSCVKFWVSGGACLTPTAADFVLASVKVGDSTGAVDTLAILGRATILGGTGSGDTADVTLEGVIPRIVLAGRQTTLQVWGTGFRAGTSVELRSSVASVRASQVTVASAQALSAALTPSASMTGPLDLVVATPSGSRGSLIGGIIASPQPSLATLMPLPPDTVTGSPPTPAAPQTILSCPYKDGIADPPPHSALYDYYYCDNSSTQGFCSLTRYPSIMNAPTTQRVTWIVADCNGNPIPNLDLAVEIDSWDSWNSGTAGHCHHTTPQPKPVGSASVGGAPCGPGPDAGTIHCAGNTGAAGLSFVVDHVWPEVAGAMRVAVFTTTPGQPFYLDRYPAFTFCASQAAAFPTTIREIADTLNLVGDNQEHPWNHFVRPKTSTAIYLAAQQWRAAKGAVGWLDALNITVNDCSLPWGGLFDACASPAAMCKSGVHQWDPPHAGHRYGWEIDLRTQVAGSPVYDRDQRDLLQAILENYFWVLKHPTGPKDPSYPHWHLKVYENRVP